MTLLVRDEQDILEDHIKYHLTHGVDEIILMDNLSVDQTAEIANKYRKDGILHYIFQGADDYSQSRWVTQMARMAYDQLGANWVINSDADEFWWAGGRSLKDTLASMENEVSAVQVDRHNFLPRPQQRDMEPFWSRMDIRQVRSVNPLGQPLPPKVIHRAHPQISVEQGNHVVQLGNVALPTVPSDILIFHFPARSARQFANKIVKGGAAYERNTELSADVGSTWRYLYDLHQKDLLNDYYYDLLLSDDDIERGLRAGHLVHDVRLKNILNTQSEIPELVTASKPLHERPGRPA